jgi:hypothetical protein
VERTIARYAALLAESRTVAEAAEVLGVDESRVRQRLAARTLYGLKRGRDWHLPAFQFADEGEVPNIGAVVSRLHPDLHPVAVANWFTLPTPDLLIEGEPVSPRDWLRSGGAPGLVAAMAAEL